MTDTIRVRASMVITDDGKWAICAIHDDTRSEWDWLHEACDYEYPAHRLWVEFEVALPPVHILRPAVTVTDKGEIAAREGGEDG